MDDYGETDFFTDLSLVDDPYPYFEYLRSRGPVIPLPAHNVVAIVGFEEGQTVHRDIEHYSAVNAVTGPLPPLPFETKGDDITAQIAVHRPAMPFGEEILTADQPHHGAMRSLVMKLFTPSRLREMESSLTALADKLIDEIQNGSGCEFLSAYAAPYATLAIADLLGVPASDRDDFRNNLAQPVSQVGQDSGSASSNPMDFYRDKFLAYVEDRRSRPRGDIISELAQAKYPDGSQPPLADVVRVASVLFGAGQDTTSTLLGSSLRILAEHPDLQDRLRADPGLLPDFIEEVLRFTGPVKSTFRLVRKTVSIGGVELAPGTTVMLSTAAMNRDPRRFDSPEEFRLGRPAAKEHLAFGRGSHTCPGAALARAEARISLQRILERLHDIQLDEAHHGSPDNRRFTYSPTYLFRGLTELHLRFC